MQDHSEDFFYLIDHDGNRRVPQIMSPRSGGHGYALHARAVGSVKSPAVYTMDLKEMVQEVILQGKGVRAVSRSGQTVGQLNTVRLKGTAIRGYWLHPDHLDWVAGGRAPEAAVLMSSAEVAPPKAAAPWPATAPKTAPVNPAVSAEPAQPLPKVLPVAPFAGAKPYQAKQDVHFADHCCQGNGGGIKSGAFSIDDLTMAREGDKKLRFAPLGNKPNHPRIALVGITPGGQFLKFASYLSSMDVPAAATKAAFGSSQGAIKALVSAHGLADHIGIDLDGDLNENHDILTTSIVKCCLMVDDGYKFAAPEIAASAAATFCATKRLVKELQSYPTLEWVFIFGAPGWNALHELQIDGQPIIDVLRGSGLKVVQLPHFANNFQQRGLYPMSEAEARQFIKDETPGWASYEPAAAKIRKGVLDAMVDGQSR